MNQTATVFFGKVTVVSSASDCWSVFAGGVLPQVRPAAVLQPAAAC